MFTFKKIALLGAASLAAFAMSCSEVDDGSGSIDGLTITDSANGIFLKGTINANEGVKVSAVTATADGKSVEVKGISGLPKAPVVLDGAYLSGVCGTSKTYSIVIKVEFDDNTTISSDAQKVAVDCGDTTPTPTPPSGTYTLSLNGDSYLDVDGKNTYKQAAAIANAALIDLAAYISSSAADKIYGACYVNTIGPACDGPAIYSTKADLEDDENEIGEEGLAIANGKVFYLCSTEVDDFKVTVTATDPANKSVTLKVEGL